MTRSTLLLLRQIFAKIRRVSPGHADKPRLFKEEKTYRVEAEDQRKVLAKLKDEDADGADIRNAVGDLWITSGGV
jgi:hypothetical protein